ncbi:hypothetical protein Tco_1186632 [Tanacetum coccineum]
MLAVTEVGGNELTRGGRKPFLKATNWADMLDNFQKGTLEAREREVRDRIVIRLEADLCEIQSLQKTVNLLIQVFRTFVWNTSIRFRDFDKAKSPFSENYPMATFDIGEKEDSDDEGEFDEDENITWNWSVLKTTLELRKSKIAFEISDLIFS